MPFRVLFKLHPSRDRLVYVAGRHDPLFDHAMREDHNRLAMEKVEYPVVPALQPRTKFIHAVPEVIRFRPAEFMPKFLESLYLDATFVQRLEGKRIQPIEHRDVVGILLVEDNLNLPEPSAKRLPLCSQYCERLSSVFSGCTAFKG
jgi:hypothetical protein